jgi:hypothetical protein
MGLIAAAIAAGGVLTAFAKAIPKNYYVKFQI